MTAVRSGGHAPLSDAPLLSDLMPWSTAPLRYGRSWILSPDAASLTARWDRLVGARGAEREALFEPSRARTQHSAVAALPGRATGTGRFARESGRCPRPLRVLHGPFDEQWLIPDHRLIDAARPELWRVADEHQIFAVEQGWIPGAATGPALLVSALLPDGRSPAGRPGRIRPLYRRPGGAEPNLAPGLTALLTARYGREVTGGEVLAWAVAAAAPSAEGTAVPLTADPGVWAGGVELGRRMIEIQLRGARGGERPRLPGGRRPYVRAAVPAVPGTIAYDSGDEALLLGTGRISPVPAGAWDFLVGGVRMLELWFERRTRPAGPGTLEAIGPSAWQREWTSELLELITVLALLAELRPRQKELREGPAIGRAELYGAGILPVPAAARRPASVLDHHEEGPDGQFALI
ncbi:type ISP restriction/modification enzyme [Streptomyces sp. AK02-01A]|uniref:type ISP restriction/modification enzyme n=1 Tax=Streptomyces sp. AK02-01A TaxID=3028648 RepID=UPI0029B1F051|nr:type ISP restriction/modification enzyme [Streptomyces sp. AK02-01A]MDX3850572.1 DNA methyltransferase [Streptomyces sp. AK02-01A]